MTQPGKGKASIVIVAVVVVAAGLLWWIFSDCTGGAAARQHRKAMELLPEGTTVVVTADAKFLAEEAFDELAKGLGLRIDDEGTRKEVGDLFETRLGFDPLKVETLTVFVYEDDVGMLIRGDLEFDPSVGRSEDYEGHTITELDGHA